MFGIKTQKSKTGYSRIGLRCLGNIDNISIITLNSLNKPNYQNNFYTFYQTFQTLKGDFQYQSHILLYNNPITFAELNWLLHEFQKVQFVLLHSPKTVEIISW